MSSRDTWKQLLIAESELNRANLVADLTRLRLEARRLARPATRMRSLLRTLPMLLGGWLGMRRARAAADAASAGGMPWLRILSRAAGLVAAVWTATRPDRRRGG
jgi:hypothetical protein